MINPKGLLLIIIVLIIGCTEIPPTLNRPIDIPTETDRKVLVEEYTGVRCGNCPAGTALLQSLKEDLGNKLVVVSFHAGFFAKPYPSSTQDFKTTETEALQSLLGEPLGYPAATINRKIFDNDASRILNASDWAIRIQQELEVSSPFMIENNFQFNQSMNQVDIQVKATLLQDLSQDAFLSVFLVEDNIVNAQATPDNIQEDYLHRHILRKIISPLIGQPVNLNSNGESASYSFNVQLDPLWKPQDLSIISFLHENGEQLQVFQVEEKLLSE